VSPDDRPGLRRAVAANARAVDVLLIAAVPAVLVAVFFLPEPTRRALVLDYRQPTAVTLYASHFVHFGPAHLAANVAVYALAVPATYAFAVAGGRRGDFLAAFGAVLAVFPYALSGLNAVFVRPSVGFGFSGLAMAYLGVLPVVLAAFVRHRLLPAVTLDHAPLLFFVGVGAVALVTASTAALALAAVALAAVGALAYAVSLSRAVDAASARAALHRRGDAEVAVAGAVVVAAAPALSVVPRAGGGAVVNVYSHLLGFCLGFLAPYAALRAAAALD
jgi:hypothetical protein